MIYLDSCIVIYAVEDEGSRGATVRQRLADSGSAEVAISHLVTVECLVGPMRSDNLALHDHYLRAFEQFTILELGQAQFRRGPNFARPTASDHPTRCTSLPPSSRAAMSCGPTMRASPRQLAVDVLA